MPKVSIITATYNSDKFIIATYESIKSQTLTDWEWLITDDCSSDKTKEFLNKIQSEDSRVRVFHNAVNSGAAISRNCSISHATGEYLAFIDSDDLWVKEKLSEQISFMEKYDYGFSFTGYKLMDESGVLINKYIDVDRRKKSFNYRDMLLKKATLGCSTVILKCDRFDDLMMPDIRTGQDYALWLKILKNGGAAFLLDKPLMHYRIVSNSISRNKIKKAKRQWSIYRKIERIPLPFSLYCFLNYIVRAITR